MVSFENRILRMLTLFVLCTLGSILSSKPQYLFLLEVFSNLLEAFVFLKIAEPNIQKPLDESNKINTDNLMWMTLHVDLHFMACLVCTSENSSTTSSVKHWKILQRDLARRYQGPVVLAFARPCAHKSLNLKLSSNFFTTMGVRSHSSCCRPRAAHRLGFFGACGSVAVWLTIALICHPYKNFCQDF